MARFSCHACLVLTAFALAACGDARGSERPIISAATDSASTAASERPMVSAATRRARERRVAWPVTVEGLGPLKPGMSLAQAVLALEGDLYTRDKSLECSYYRSARAPGMKFMFLDRRLARIEVDSGTGATPEGIRVGSTEAQVRSAYGDRVNASPHKYTDGRYLTVVGAADTVHRLIFETDGKRVLKFRTGIIPAVGWVEGCS